jgi:nucleoside-diphosphate-sugar epimerase
VTNNSSKRSDDRQPSDDPATVTGSVAPGFRGTAPRALVTGGAGFIGSSIVRRLHADGQSVRVLDDLSTGRRSNLADLERDIDVIVGDLRDPQALARAVAGIDVVFHQAAIPSVPRSISDPVTTVSVNIDGTLALLLAARDAGVRRVVFASSSSVYGDAPEPRKHEALPPRPLSPYAISKLTGEQLLAVFFRIYGLETVALRYFNVFGPRQDPASAYAAVIPRFVRILLAGERPTIFGDGKQSRDFTYIDNVVQANLLAATAPGVAGEVFNIASGRAIDIDTMYARVAAQLGTDIAPNYADPRPGDIRNSLADIARAEARLGYAVAVNFEEGLRRTVDALASDLARAGQGTST